MTFGQRLKQRRDALNMTREEVALASGVHYAQVGRYEIDANQPPAEAIVALARALGVSTDWLLGTSEVYGMESLSDLERQAIVILRSKFPERQQTLVDVMKVF